MPIFLLALWAWTLFGQLRHSGVSRVSTAETLGKCFSTQQHINIRLYCDCQSCSANRYVYYLWDYHERLCEGLL